MSIPEAIDAARDRIDRATSACGRTDSVTLELAVKTRTPEECRAAATALAEAGLPILLGHNRVQERARRWMRSARCPVPAST